MYEEQGPDDMKSEFPSRIDECFYSSLEGAYFKREMTKARDDKRIGLPVPYDPVQAGQHLLGHRHGRRVSPDRRRPPPPDRILQEFRRGPFRKHRLEWCRWDIGGVQWK